MSRLHNGRHKNKREPGQHVRDLSRTAEMYLQGKTQLEIAKELGLTQAQICYDLKKIRREWQQSQLSNFDQKVNLELSKLDELEAEAWLSWEKSKEGKTTTSRKKRVGGGGGKDSGEVCETKEVSTGDPRFLDVVARCINKRCDILGINAPKKIEATGKDGAPLGAGLFVLPATLNEEEIKAAIQGAVSSASEEA